MNNYKNIPTDLLRTFLSVVELRSYTRAAHAQGITQPAVSAQIRRLQSLLEVDLLDKSAPGVSLTVKGEEILNAARRLLSLNDHILQMARPTSQMVRVGAPGDCMGDDLTRLLKSSRAQWPYLRFSVDHGGQKRLLHGLNENEYDLVVALVIDEPGHAARYCWAEQLVWVRGKSTVLDPEAPVPLVSYSNGSVCHRVAVSTLDTIGRASEFAFGSTSTQALISAVAAGVGIMAMPRRRVPRELQVWQAGPLPPLPDVFCGIFARQEADWDVVDQLADCIAETLGPPEFAKAARARAARLADRLVSSSATSSV